MLTDEQIHEIATAHIKRSGADLSLSIPIHFKDPDGVFYKVHRPNIQKSTNLRRPRPQQAAARRGVGRDHQGVRLD
jgi:hypothetical protein